MITFKFEFMRHLRYTSYSSSRDFKMNVYHLYSTCLEYVFFQVLKLFMRGTKMYCYMNTIILGRIWSHLSSNSWNTNVIQFTVYHWTINRITCIPLDLPKYILYARKIHTGKTNSCINVTMNALCLRAIIAAITPSLTVREAGFYFIVPCAFGKSTSECIVNIIHIVFHVFLHNHEIYSTYKYRNTTSSIFKGRLIADKRDR